MNVNENLINKRAFTLVELMIAISIALLITTIASKAILTGTRSANVLTSKVYAQKSVRSAISFIAKDLMAAESITNPAIGATDSGLTIQGSKFKQAAMTSTWSGNPDPTTKFKAAGSSQGVAWTKGKPPVVYVVEEENGDPIAQSSGYTLNYEEGLVDFIIPDSSRVVTADFSTEITITYSLDNTITNNTRLMRGSLVIADHVENTDIFEREADKMFNINVTSREFALRTTIDASTGSYVVELESPPTAENLNSAFFTDENSGWVAGDNGALYEFAGVGQTWPNHSIGSANLNSINFADESTGTIVGNNGTILQHAGGVWTPDAPVASNLTGVFNKDKNSVLAVGVNAGTGISYTYDGTGWESKIDATSTVPFNDISEYVSDKYVVADSGKIYSAGSNIWNEFYDAGDQNLSSITINGKDADLANYFIWVAGNGGTLLRHDSTKSDNVWAPYTNTNFGNLRALHFFDEKIGWAVGDAGVILRYDVELDQWFEIPSGTVENLNDVFMYSKDEGYIVGDNGTFLKIGSVRL